MVTRQGAVLLLSLGIGAAAGCGELSDPAAPCTAIELGEAQPASMVSHRFAAPFAMTAEKPFVLHCAGSQDSHCELGVVDLEAYGVERGDAVLLTSTGNYAVSVNHDNLLFQWFQLDRDAPGGILDDGQFKIPDDGPVQLVASLRGSDWILVRDRDSTRPDALGRLGRIKPGQYSMDVFGEEASAMRVAAIGHQHIVVRLRRGNDEELQLIGVDEELPYAEHDPLPLGPPARPASRVVFAGDDERVAVTRGSGDSAETFVFSVPDGVLVDRFPGEMVSGRGDTDELPGMSAASPDGSHLAYRTPSGALALRDLESSNSCMVRSAHGGNHSVAGFSAQGRLYMQADRGHRSAVLTWDPSTQRHEAIADMDQDFTLITVPGRDPVEGGRPWAAVAQRGRYATLAAGGEPNFFPDDDVMFIPRDDAGMFVASREDGSNGAKRLHVYRVEPVVDTVNRTYDLETIDEEVSRRVGTSRVCMATSNPGAAYRCGRATDAKFLAAPSSGTEDPSGSQSPGDEVPNPANPSCDGPNGAPQGTVDRCDFAADDGCCYDNYEEACLGAGCDLDQCELTLDGQTQTQRARCTGASSVLD